MKFLTSLYLLPKTYNLEPKLPCYTISMRKVALFFFFLLTNLSLTGCSYLGPQKAGLQVMTAEIPSGIYLDGKFLENTPYLAKDLKPGRYLLEIRPQNSDYAPYETEVSLRKGLLTVVTWKPGERPESSGGVIYEMNKLDDSKKTAVSITTIPDRSLVSFDGGEKQFAPLELSELSPGHHEFEISLPSYESQKHTMNVIEGYEIEVTVTLAKQDFVSEPSALTETVEDEKTDLANDEAEFLDFAEIDGPQVLILSTNFFRNNKEVLRVRDRASSGGQELGFAEVGEKYPYLEEEKSGWYKIEFEGEDAWVSAQYAKIEE